MQNIAPKIAPCLWFDTEAEDAMNFYTSVFRNSKKGKVMRHGEAGPGPAGTVLAASFELNGLEFMALNGGPQFKFTEAVSFQIPCESQEDVDYYWDKLIEGGGMPSQCGWLKDKFGLSWQVFPTMLPKLLGDPDRAKANRVMTAMMQMIKIDIPALEKAAAG
jgi:predicted 3-demethylubiquinone-9 3-methyltransferase (glyoxalase superfamily)